MTMSRQRPARRGAMTLVELLVVITIMTVLMVLVVTSLRPAMQNRKTREASRLVVAAVAQAKARAAELGRPVGLWIERSDLDIPDPTVNGGSSFNVATEIYMAESPAPYAGDFAESTALLVDSNGDGLPDRARFDRASNSGFNLAAPHPLVRPGDFIKFNYKGPAYPIIGIWEVAPGGDFWVLFGSWGPGPDMVWGSVGDDDGVAPAEDIKEAGWGGSDDIWLSPPPPMAPGRRVPYQVFRQPERVGAGTELPAGVCIDLSNSGFGILGRDFGRNPAGNFLTGAVIIQFTPSGRVSNVTYGGATALATTTIHLQIGQIEQFEEDEASPLPLSSTLPALAPFNRNLTDPNSLWISIGNVSGNATSSPNTWRLVGEAAPPNQFNPPHYYNSSMAEARDLAVESQNMGAR